MQKCVKLDAVCDAVKTSQLCQCSSRFASSALLLRHAACAETIQKKGWKRQAREDKRRLEARKQAQLKGKRLGDSLRCKGDSFPSCTFRGAASRQQNNFAQQDVAFHLSKSGR